MSRLSPSASAGPRARLRAYLECEDGGATIWSLTWLLGFAVMAGVAIDSTNGWRHKTMLQSTADVAALAGAMNLPNLELEAEYADGSYGEVEEAAVQFAGANMGGEYGDYFAPDLYDEDIRIGHWDVESREFTEGASPVNAVRVEHAQIEDRANGVATAFLHMIDHNLWDVRTAATAIRGLDPCLLNGIIARETLSLNANKMEIDGDVCIHGQLAVEVSPGGAWAQEDALSLGKHREEVSDPWIVKKDQRELVDGELGDSIWEEMQDPNDHWDRYPPMVDQIVEIGWSMLAGVKGYRNFPHEPIELLDADSPQPTVVRLPNNFTTVLGTGPVQQTWWRIGSGTQLASLDGFGNIAALLGLSAATSSSMVIDYRRTWRYTDGVHVQSGGSSSEFEWPVNDTDIDIEATVNGRTVQWTNDGAPGPGVTEATLPEGRIYFAGDCKGGNDGTLNLTGHIRNVTIVTNCKIDIASDAVIENAVLLTTAMGPNASSAAENQAVAISNGATIGSVCKEWGGVRIYSNGDISTVVPQGQSGESTFYGTQLVARDDIRFAARADTDQGISMLAGGRIDIRPQAKIGAISADDSGTGCPQTGGVDFEYDEFAYRASLVD